MWVDLDEVLALPSFQAAQVRVVAGPRTARIRWVHSSEVFEMGSLLAGGELLLTTGLGLHGRTGEQLAGYLDQLADAGCTALAVELGRTFLTMPDALVRAAERRRMALLEIHAIVPFERMVEDFHELLLARRTQDAALPRWSDLLQVVIEGRGLRALLDEVSRAAGCVVEVRDPEGRLLEQSRIVSSAAAEATRAHVRGADGPLGTVELRCPETARSSALAEQAALAVALEFGRHSGPAAPVDPAQPLISDLAAHSLVAAADVERRLREAGWVSGEDRHLLALAIDVGAASWIDTETLDACFPEGLGPPLTGRVGSDLVVLGRGWTRPLPQQVRSAVEEFAAALHAALPEQPAVLIATAVPVLDRAELADAVAGARGVLRTARRFGIGSGAVMARDLAAPHLIATEVDPQRLSRFIVEQIGPLIDHDREHRTELLRTLNAYLASGTAKAATAEHLGIRRQSLYDRLDRIERLLGVSLAEPTQRAGLVLALLAWRMRTGLDPQLR